MEKLVNSVAVLLSAVRLIAFMIIWLVIGFYLKDEVYSLAYALNNHYSISDGSAIFVIVYSLFLFCSYIVSDLFSEKVAHYFAVFYLKLFHKKELEEIFIAATQKNLPAAITIIDQSPETACTMMDVSAPKWILVRFSGTEEIVHYVFSYPLAVGSEMPKLETTQMFIEPGFVYEKS